YLLDVYVCVLVVFGLMYRCPHIEYNAIQNILTAHYQQDFGSSLIFHISFKIYQSNKQMSYRCDCIGTEIVGNQDMGLQSAFIQFRKRQLAEMVFGTLSLNYQIRKLKLYKQTFLYR
ncbi:hypothetical protein ACJX0J_028681, partial [Zea mays]